MHDLILHERLIDWITKKTIRDICSGFVLLGLAHFVM